MKNSWVNGSEGADSMEPDPVGQPVGGATRGCAASLELPPRGWSEVEGEVGGEAGHGGTPGWLTAPAPERPPTTLLRTAPRNPSPFI